MSRRTPRPLRPYMPPAGYFLSLETESTQRTPPKPMVLDSLRGRDAEHIGILHLANKTEKPRPMLSHCPCVYPPRRAPRLCCSGITEIPPCVCRPARCGHRALRNSIVKRCVGDDAHIVPPHLFTFLSSLPPHNFSLPKAVLLACRTALCYDTIEFVWEGETLWLLSTLPGRT